MESKWVNWLINDFAKMIKRRMCVASNQSTSLAFSLQLSSVTCIEHDSFKLNIFLKINPVVYIQVCPFTLRFLLSLIIQNKSPTE